MNAKQELLGKLNGATIKCAKLYMNGEYSRKNITLKVNHTPDELEGFLSLLDVEYDDGYGCQVLFGTVWLDSLQWLERGEYDGSEWWNWKVIPEIPEDLK